MNIDKNTNLVTAVIVLYNDMNAIKLCLDSCYAQVDKIIVVDNSTDNATAFSYSDIKEKITYIKNNENLGLDKALNIGITLALTDENIWVLLLDQDSILEQSMIGNMLDSYSNAEEKENIAQIVPTVYDTNKQKYLSALKYNTFSLEKIFSPKLDRYVDFQITSGSLIDKQIFNIVGMMDERFFIDYIDFDYCFKLRKNSYKILLSSKAILYHSLGERKKIASIEFTEHSPFRIYYQVRNRLFIMREYGRLFPYYVISDGINLILKFFKIILIESNKSKKISNYFKGLYDGIRFE